MNETMPFQEIQRLLIEPLVDTQRQIFGQHGLGDFRKPTLQVQHDATEVTDFRFVEAKILKGQNGPQAYLLLTAWMLQRRLP